MTFVFSSSHDHWDKKQQLFLYPMLCRLRLRRVGEWEVALALLHQMLALDYEPDGRILGSVISVVRREAMESGEGHH